jgi:hypothetical protein
MIVGTYEELRLGFEGMRSVVLDDSRLSAYLSEVFPDPMKGNPEAMAKVVQHRTIAAHFYRKGRGNEAPGVQGTLWAAYNGVTEYIDHRKPNVRANDFSQSRLQYVWFGAGATIKQRALVHAPPDC